MNRILLYALATATLCLSSCTGFDANGINPGVTITLVNGKLQFSVTGEVPVNNINTTSGK